MLTTIRKNNSLTFYQKAQPTFRSTSPALVGGVFPMSVSTSTAAHTSNIFFYVDQLKKGIIERGTQYANNTQASRGGFMAENWHAGTYDLNAVIKGSSDRATVNASTESGSADISWGKGQEASIKYYADAKSSAFAQTNPDYGNQKRIVPSDQLPGSKYVLDKRIDLNTKKGRDDAAALQEKTKELLDDRIRGDKGVESTPLSKEQDMSMANAVKNDSEGNASVDNKQINNVIKDTGVRDKVKNAVTKNELKGLGIAVAIGLGVGFTIGFAVTLAQAGITPESLKLAALEGVKGSSEAGALSAIGYGISHTIGEIVTKTLTGLLENIGFNITENIVKMSSMAVCGLLTIAVFSAWQFIKLKRKGIGTREALMQVGKQAAFSLTVLAVSIAAQGIWGGGAGIVVSVSVGIIMITYSLANAAHSKAIAEKVHVYMINKYQPYHLAS
ncbi:MAG: hypothetical protein ACYDG2_00935 [Ruminiclostridium sp.]